MQRVICDFSKDDWLGCGCVLPWGEVTTILSRRPMRRSLPVSSEDDSIIEHESTQAKRKGSLLPKAKNNVGDLKCAHDFKNKNSFCSIWIGIVSQRLKQQTFWVNLRKRKVCTIVWSFCFWKHWSVSTRSDHRCWQTWPGHKGERLAAASWLSVSRSNSPTRSLGAPGLCVFPSLSVAVCACHPSPGFHSVSENNYFLHKLQSPSQQHAQQRQTACGCPGTPRFSFAQTQHGLPGTTGVTRAPASCPRPQPRPAGVLCIAPSPLLTAGQGITPPRRPERRVLHVCLWQQRVTGAFWRLIHCQRSNSHKTR